MESMNNGRDIFVELISIETHSTFRMAAEHARDLAIEYRSQVSLQRAEAAWQVLVAADVAKKIQDDAAREAAEQEEFDIGRDQAEDERWEQSEWDESIAVERDRQNELREEFSSDLDDWGRSEETGWCYGDDD